MMFANVRPEACSAFLNSKGAAVRCNFFSEHHSIFRYSSSV